MFFHACGKKSAGSRLADWCCLLIDRPLTATSLAIGPALSTGVCVPERDLPADSLLLFGVKVSTVKAESSLAAKSGSGLAAAAAVERISASNSWRRLALLFVRADLGGLFLSRTETDMLTSTMATYKSR
jgi:hypothetical protein